MTVCKHLKILGSVQGVFFRESMAREARRLAVTGWVRNRPDGSVEAMVQGEPEAVAAIIAWAQRGPELAKVSQVVVSDDVGNFAEFVPLPTQ